MLDWRNEIKSDCILCYLKLDRHKRWITTESYIWLVVYATCFTYIYIYIYIKHFVCVNNWVHYDRLVVFVSLHITLPHYHHYADASEGIDLLKYLSGTFCPVCVKDWVNCLNYFHAVCGPVCIQLTTFFVMTVRIRVLYLIIIIKSDVWSICRLELGHDEVCLSMFSWVL